MNNILNLNNLMKDYNRVSKKNEVLKLANKWRKTGLLEGLEKNENKITKRSGLYFANGFFKRGNKNIVRCGYTA